MLQANHAGTAVLSCVGWAFGDITALESPTFLWESPVNLLVHFANLGGIVSWVYNCVFYLGWTDLCTHLPMKVTSHSEGGNRFSLAFRAETKSCLQELNTPERQHQLHSQAPSTRLHLVKGPQPKHHYRKDIVYKFLGDKLYPTTAGPC